MKQLRNTSYDCITCGGNVPGQVELETVDGVKKFRCAECDKVIAQGIVATDGEPAVASTTPPRAEPMNPVTLPDDSHFHTWETWWTELFVCTAIHGKVVAGETELLDFISKLYDIYEHS